MVRAKKSDSQIARLLKELDDLLERAPDLADPIEFYRVALPVLHEAQANVEPFTLAAETARIKLETGLSLLVGEELPLNIDATHALFMQLCRITESLHTSSNGKGRPGWFFSRGQPKSLNVMEPTPNGDAPKVRTVAAQQIRHAIEKEKLDLSALWSATAEGDMNRIAALVADGQLDSGLVSLFAQNSLKPSLRKWAQGLTQTVDLEDWRHGYCPFCGSPPLLAEIQGKEGERRLRCGVCGADWHYARLKCAFCANQNHKTLGYITVEGEEEKYHLQTCDQCRGYLKVIVTFDPTPVELLAVEDLTTLHLDLIATERGYEHF
jgi:hypothetical protein